LQFPYLWQALGVKAVLKAQSGGYTAEIAIPFEVMQWTAGNRPEFLRMNVRVFDSNGGSSYARSVGWSVDPYDTTSRSSEFYKLIRFSGTTLTARTDVVESASAQRRTAVLDVMESIAKGDIAAALALLQSLPTEPWMLPLMAATQQAGRQWEISISTLNEIVEKEQSQSVVMWARERLAVAYRRTGDIESAKVQYRTLASLSGPDAAEIGSAGLAECERDTRGDAAAIMVYEEALTRLGRFNAKLLSDLGDTFARSERYQEALATYQKLADAKEATARQKSLALLRIQQVQSQHGAVDDSVDTGWRIQELGAGADLSRQASLPLLIQSLNRQRDASLAESPTESLSPSFRIAQVLSSKNEAITTKQLLELGELYGADGQLDEAMAVFTKACSINQAPRADKALALLRMQELLAVQGKAELSLAAGLRLQTSFEDEMLIRLRGLNLMRASCGAARTGSDAGIISYRRAARRFASDLLRWLNSGDSSSRQASYLWTSFVLSHPEAITTAATQQVAPR
jgi:tetratricopeptide (TPR) repeat protein